MVQCSTRVDHGNTRAFVHVLAGVGVVDGAVPARDTEYHGWLARFSYAVGGGVEHCLWGHSQSASTEIICALRFLILSAQCSPKTIFG